jgi:hypothetical protein
MTKARISLAIAGLLATSVASANGITSVQVIGKCGQSIDHILKSPYEYQGKSVLKVSEELLQVNNKKIKAGERGYVESISGLGADRECTAQGVKAWGWNGSLNGQDLDAAPSEVEVEKSDSKIKWTYVYVLLGLPEGKTCADKDAVDQAEACAEQDADGKECPAHEGTPADCASK